jgi:Mrp family chromosome partitioning ATPase
MNETDQKEAQIKANLSRIKHRIMVMSGKGGVGKSFVAVNLAYGLALQGKTVGLLDADIHGPSVAKLTHIEGRSIQAHPQTGMPMPIKVFSNLYVLTVASLLGSENNALIWRGPLKMALLKQFFSDFQWEELDYLIVDCPPGTGDEPLSIKQILGYLDGAVIVTTPQDIAILDVRKSVDFAHKLELPILGVIENMKLFRCPHCQETTDIFKGEQLDKMLLENDLDLLAELEIDPLIVQSSDEGKPYIYYYNKQPAAHKLQDAVERIIEKVEGESKHQTR